MPSLIDIRRRIRTVRNTQQITKAMKMVSAAKLRRAQERVMLARPYASILKNMLADVAMASAANEHVSQHPLLVVRPEQRVQLLLLTADRGLAGAFNSNLIRASQQFLSEHKDAQVELELLGRKGRDYYRRRNVAISGEHVGLFQKALYEDVAPIARKVIERYRAAEIDAVYILYNEFKSVVSQKVTVARVLPVELPEQAHEIDYIYEQPPERMLDPLLARYVEIALHHAVLESAAAEHGARMTAMDAATTNATEMIEKLTLYMNRVRQASITREIIEVVSGASALV